MKLDLGEPIGTEKRLFFIETNRYIDSDFVSRIWDEELTSFCITVGALVRNSLSWNREVR